MTARKPDRMGGDLAARTADPVPGVDLPHAALVRRVDQPVRGVRGPVGKEQVRGAEARFPGRLAGISAQIVDGLL